jgi:hypothetical protein
MPHLISRLLESVEGTVVNGYNLGPNAKTEICYS